MLLALDIAVVVLLVVTIGYAVVLNRKLGDLRSHKDDLEKLAATFSHSTARAEDSIARLKGNTERLQKSIDKAQALRDDLTFLIDRGSQTADRLEDGVRGSRDKVAAAATQPEPAARREEIETLSDVLAAARSEAREGSRRLAESPEDIDKQKSQAERDLIEALRQAR